MGGFLEIEATMNDVNQLLKEYAANGSEPAFRELVTRYVDLVYSVALRRLKGDEHRAEEVTQTVFTDLAQKAATLPERVMLGGWLHRHTGFVAGNYVRGEIRRQVREKEAATMMLHESEETNWQEVAPFLDEAIDQLDSSDREAVLLRYFEKRDLRSLGAYLGISEDAAQKRVSRAVDKLRDLLAERGVKIAAIALGAMLMEQAVSAGPAGLAAVVGSKALKGIVPASVTMGLLSWGLFKGLMAVLVVSAVIAVTVWPRSSTSDGDQRSRAKVKGEVLTAEKRRTSLSEPFSTAHAMPVETGSGAVKSNFLRLKLMTVDTKEPIPNVQIDMQWIGKDGFVRKSIQGNHLGEVAIPVIQEMEKNLKLVTQLDGFASTSLQWISGQGDIIPETYTVMLERSVPIGGSVVDSEGHPVGGAIVSFGAGIDPKLKGIVQTHEFGVVRTTTDAEGRWKIDRIAKDMFSRISGSASHPKHVRGLIGNDSLSAEQLKSEAYVVRMGKAVTVRGQVFDQSGVTLPGAKILVGYRDEVNSRTGETRSDGTFEIVGCMPERGILTAEFKGLAPLTEEVDISDEKVRHQLVLKPGNALLLRVRDQQGNPIADADVRLAPPIPTGSWSLGSSPPKAPTQVEFAVRTDETGLAIWKNAPENELKFNIGARGAIGVHDYKVRADSTEHVVTLMRRMVVNIQGEVRDSETGEPIPKFRIITGSPQPQFQRKNEYIPFWSNQEQHWHIFSKGIFQLALYEAAISGQEKAGYLLKFEADGYASYVTGVIPEDAGKVSLNVVMRKAPSQWVLVRLPDGSPAKGMEVGLVSPGAGIALAPGELKSSAGIKIISAFISADQKGLFELKSDSSVTRVVAVHEAGYAEASIEELMARPTLEIKPWGKIEGVLIKDGNPLAGADIQIDFQNASHTTLNVDRYGFIAKTDELGRFIIPKAPFGTLKMFHRFHMVNSYSDIPLATVEVRSGETTRVKLETKYEKSW